jgi:hypothetical protein
MAKLTDHERRVVFKVLGEFRSTIAALCAQGLLRMERFQYVATIKAKLIKARAERG